SQSLIVRNLEEWFEFEVHPGNKKDTNHYSLSKNNDDDRKRVIKRRDCSMIHNSRLHHVKYLGLNLEATQ
ncbi:hypothetical protein AVEN_161036-1, partial [Araneus ventricosus]